jgi:competence protein ComEC
MKKLSVVLIALTMLISIFVPQTLAKSNFSDVPSTYSFHEEIMYLSGYGIINGYNDNTFKPNQEVSRAAAAAMIGRAIGLDGEKRATKFKDVGASSFASGYIDSAVEEGIIKGFTDGTFRPNEIVTRGQMAIFLARAFELKQQGDNNFKDVTPQMAAYSSILQILREGITGGYNDGTFRPNLDVTRAQFSAFLARALNPYFRVDNENPTPLGDMEVDFIDVGQGDSILITTPNDSTILVDGGRKSEGETVLSYLEEKGTTSLDLVVATHPDADHIGGLIDVLDQIDVKKVLDSGKSHTSQTYLEYLSLIDEKNIPFQIATAGEYLDIDPEVEIRVLNSGEGYSDNNDASVVLKVSHGEVDYLLTGDAGIEAEENMINANYNLDAEVLKVGHHGSDTSTSQEFVEAVNPIYGILSYGEGNSYGHPHSEVYNRLVNHGVELISTAIGGTIEMQDDGEYIYIGQDPSIPTPEPEPTPEPTENVYISDVDLDGETVTVMNGSGENVDISGWYLVSEEGNQRYDFPQGSTIEEGYYITVWSGPDAENRPPYYQLWTNGYIWNNSGDAALLYNAQGELVSEVR